MQNIDESLKGKKKVTQFPYRVLTKKVTHLISIKIISKGSEVIEKEHDKDDTIPRFKMPDSQRYLNNLEDKLRRLKVKLVAYVMVAVQV